MSIRLFDKWSAKHKKTCGAVRFDVSLECLVEGETQIEVRCPTCRDSISGSAEADLLDIAARLAPGQQLKAS